MADTTPVQEVTGPFEAPNLDGMTLDDVVESQKALEALAQYAKLKGEAMRQRMAGFIKNAIRYERKCDAVYDTLPPWARW